MKLTRFSAAVLAAFALGLAVSACSSMLNSLSSSIEALNEKLSEGVEIAPVPDEGKEKAAALAEANKAAAAKKADTKAASSASKSASASATPAPVKTVVPKGTSLYEFVGTPYTVLPKGTDGTAGKTGTYVLFGDWPQSIKAPHVVVDESKIAVVGAHTYYKGSDGAWYIKIMERKAGGYEGPNGFRYSDGTKVQNAYKKSYRYFKVEPIKWRVLTTNYNGSGKKLLLAEVALTNEQFSDTWGDYAVFEAMDGNRYAFTLDVTLRQLENGQYIQHNNYEHSRMRAFLNGIAYIQGDENIYVKGAKTPMRINEEFVGRGFLQTAFTPAMQSKIAVTTVENNSRKNSGIDLVQEFTAVDRSIYDGTMYYESGEQHKRVTFPKFTSNDTKDKVFLLSPAEVVRKDYGFILVPPTVTPNNIMDLYRAGKTWTTAETVNTYKGLAHPMTDFARGNGVAHFSDEVVTTWWLRTPVLPPYFHRISVHREDQQAAAVTDISETGSQTVNNSSVGVVPAICVN